MTNRQTQPAVFDEISRRIDGSIAAIESLRDMEDDLRAVISALIEVLQAGGTIYTCGNGGSAAEAMHLAEELIGRYRADRKPLRAICLNADSAALTCIGNDFGFDEIFARQCEALLTERDALVVFSTSGNSPNIVRALERANACECIAIGLLGKDGGPAQPLCTHALVIPGRDSAHIQEAHQVVLHLICEACEHPFR